MTDHAITITLNGTLARAAQGHSLPEVLRASGQDPDRHGIAVAVNGQVVRRQQWPETRLVEGDQVEVITAFQGG